MFWAGCRRRAGFQRADPHRGLRRRTTSGWRVRGPRRRRHRRRQRPGRRSGWRPRPRSPPSSARWRTDLMTACPGDDRGLTLGDGLFETVLARDGDAGATGTRTWQRLARGCAVLGLPAPDPAALAPAAAERRWRRPGSPRRAAVRLTWTAGSGRPGPRPPGAPSRASFATAAPAPEPQGPGAPDHRAGSPQRELAGLAAEEPVLPRQHPRAGARRARRAPTRP